MADETTTADPLYLTPQALLLVRHVWQGRVVWQRSGRAGHPRFHRDDKPMHDIPDIETRWLRDNGYVEHAPLTPDEQWALVNTTDLGDAVLAHVGADTDRFHDMSATEARLLVG